MYYCEECGDRNKWPTEHYMPRRHGKCQVCGKPDRPCLDVPETALTKSTNWATVQR